MQRSPIAQSPVKHQDQKVIQKVLLLVLRILPRSVAGLYSTMVVDLQVDSRGGLLSGTCSPGIYIAFTCRASSGYILCSHKTNSSVAAEHQSHARSRSDSRRRVGDAPSKLGRVCTFRRFPASDDPWSLHSFGLDNRLCDRTALDVHEKHAHLSAAVHC